MPNHSPTQLPPSPTQSRSLRDPHAQMQPYVQAGPSKHPALRTDDGRYVAKYKELKQKVKDIELDNDRLHIKVLKTRKNIQRLRIERAILYERLSSMPNADLPLTSSSTAQPQPQGYTQPPPHFSPDAPPPAFPQDHRPHPPSPPPPRLHHPFPPVARPPPPPNPNDRQRQRRDLPVTLPPPPNMPFPPPHLLERRPSDPHPSEGPAYRGEPAYGPRPTEQGYSHAPPPESGYWRDRDHDRERDRERVHLGGPGLPPMRTRRPESPSSAYAHPLQHPFMPADDRPWEHDRDREREHEREYPPPHDRDHDHERSHANGATQYRDEHNLRYDAEHSNNGHALPPPRRQHEYRRSHDGPPRRRSSADEDGSTYERPGPRKHPRTSEDEHVPRVQEGEAMD